MTNSFRELATELVNACSDASTVLFDAPFGERTTYRVGGRATIGLDLGSQDDALAAATVLADANAPVLIYGNGSNLLVADRGYRGVAVRYFPATIELDLETAQVSVLGGADLPVVARRTVEAGLTGFEWAVGVPGSFGGAVAMNAGGHGADMAASLVRATSIDLNRGPMLVTRSASELALGYRRSAILPSVLVLGGVIQLSDGDPDQSRATLRDVVRWRRANQPGGQNAGSVFANPPRASAGALIEQAGLKGFRIGSAEVSTKHANFIQADELGSADDVYAVIAHVTGAVFEAFGIELHLENRLVGFEDHQ